MMSVFMYLLMLIFMLGLIKNYCLIYFSYFSLFFLMLVLMMKNNFLNIYSNLYSLLFFDSINFILILLSVFMISLMLMVSFKVIYKKYFVMNLLALLLILMISFSSMNFFIFYLFFEASLIPTFFLILGWGYQPERIKAGFYMLMYTLFSSLPLLILIFMIYSNSYTLMYMYLLNNYMNFNFNLFLFYFYMIFSFLMKLPLFIFHMWLPKAHLEAPLSGSMILAGVMLKLGGYGLMRTMMMMINYSLIYNFIFMVISLWGLIYLSFLCLRQYDMKLIVAYSSVVHMGVI